MNGTKMKKTRIKHYKKMQANMKSVMFKLKNF